MSQLGGGISIWVLIAAALPGGASAQGNELFRTTPRFAVGNGPVAIATCDLNEDGHPDIVTANQLFDDVAVLLNNTNGGFLPQIRFGVAAQPREIACVDLNGDSHFDVITTGAILRGNGDGTFAVGFIPFSGGSDWSVGELTQDSIPDIVATAPGNTWLHIGNEDFSFTYRGIDNVGGMRVRVGDITSDNRNDILVSNAFFFRNLGNATFDRFGGLGFCGGRSEFTLSDVDADGKKDILYPCGGVNITFGTGSGTFSNDSTLASDGSVITSVVVADVNADNRPDILTIDGEASEVGIRRGLGDRMFQAPVYFGAGRDPRSLAIADFDGDTIVDIVTANFESDDVSLLSGVGDGTFRWEPRLRVGENPQSIDICDLNHDGIADIVVVNSESNSVSVLIGRGGGRFYSEHQGLSIFIHCSESGLGLRAGVRRVDGGRRPCCSWPWR